MAALYGFTVFLSAFLLFQVQPIIAKIILPWFGGASAVWSTCMVFFQSALLLGYGYAHWLHGKFEGRKQALVHAAVLAVSLAALPILPNPAWRTQASGDPALKILALLAVTIGLPYFVLSSTSPLLQAWYARTHHGGIPWRLFALSNLASMLALLSYPVLIEPRLAARTQAGVWSIAYCAFAINCGATAWLALGRGQTAPPLERASAAANPPSWEMRVFWAMCAGCASILLLAVTTFLTQDVAAMPFLWIVPLSVYLLTFIFCFEAPRIYRRAVFLPLLAAALLFFAWRLWPHAGIPIRPLIALVAAGLFVCCMVCHGELVRRRPDAAHLTSFYVSISLGGALGAVFVGLAAPLLFNGYYEFHIGLALCAAIAVSALRSASRNLAPPWLRTARIAMAFALAAWLVLLAAAVRQSVHPWRVLARNFYSQLRVQDRGKPAVDRDASRVLVHGTINHGEQMLREEYRRMPVTYFCPRSGIGRAMQVLEGRPRRIGVLGLGCGTLAAYGRPGDALSFYEINPQVIAIARTEFTYLRDTPARVEVKEGDGRLSLESDSGPPFDLLVMDAFSGDSVPVHLITREAFHNYFRKVKPDGIGAVNITNRYLDLRPVIAAVAADLGKIALRFEFDPDDDDIFCLSCDWTLIVDPAFLTSHPELMKDAQVLRPQPGFRMWTDDFSNLLAILK